MKTKFLLILMFVATTFFVSCNKSDDDNAGETFSLNGEWHMRNVMGGFVGVDIDYERAVIVWTFNENTQMLTVENSIEPSNPEYPFSGLATGMYAFEVIDIDGTSVLQIEGADQGEYIVTATTLTIDDRPADGYLRSFEK